MKFILKRTSIFSNCLEIESTEKQEEIMKQIIGELPIKDKVKIEEMFYTITLNNNKKEVVDKVKRCIIEINSLEELIELTNNEDIVIEKQSNYSYPILKIYDDYRE